MESGTTLGIVLVLLGGFAIAGAAAEWDWFMNARKAQLWVKLFGRGGARVFYGILGPVIVVIGVLALTGVIQPRQ